MPAILVECLFVDSEDTDKYNPELIAKAIVNGLEGVENSNDYCNTWIMIVMMDIGIIQIIAK